MTEPGHINFYAVELLRLVASHRNFTAAAAQVGLSQSALTRQVQNLEQQIGTPLLERTTRSVSLTEAGAIFLRETAAIPNIMSGALRRLEEEYLETSKSISIGISNELSIAHIPGLFSNSPENIALQISENREAELVDKISENELDLAIVTATEQLPQTAETLLTIKDPFTLVIPANMEQPKSFSNKWVSAQNWLLPTLESTAASTLTQWFQKRGLEPNGSMRLENFDLMLPFVALERGVALIPRRAFSAFARKHLVQKVTISRPPVRHLALIRPRFSRVPDHVLDFTKTLLFS